MSRKNIIKLVVGLLVLVLLLGGLVWFWSLGNPLPDRTHAYRIENVTGDVELKARGSQTWTALNSAQDVHEGDSIRTGDASSAELNWDNHGVTRLDAQSQITIDRASDAAAPLQTQTTLRLDAGRVWSRLLKLLDIESSFSVKTDTVVATVRGTTFGVERNASSTRVAVAESVVSVSPIASATSSVFLPDRQVADFGGSGSASSSYALTRDDAWAFANMQQDDQVDAALRARLAARDATVQTTSPEGIVELSEQAHLWLASAAQRGDLTAAYLERRLVAAQANPSQARQLIGSLDLSVLQGPSLDRALRDVRERIFLSSMVSSSDSSQAWTDTLASLRLSLLTRASSSDAYARALVIDDRIDAVLFATVPPSLDQQRTRVAELEAQISAWERAFATTDALHFKADALRVRLAGLGAVVPAVPPAQVAPVETATSTTSTVATPPSLLQIQPTGEIKNPVPTSVAPSANQQTTSTSIVPVQTQTGICVEPTYLLVPSPAAAQVGQSVMLQLFVACADGSTRDLTARATFSLGDPQSGSLTGNVFTPSVDGAWLVRGVVLDAEAMRGASATVTVTKATRQLSSVRVAVVGSSALTTGQSTPLDAYAVYSDGTEADIKYQCVWSTSNPQLALISNATLQSLSGTGTVSAICTYTENNITKSGSSDVSIALDPSLMPTVSGSSLPLTRILFTAPQ